MGVRSTVLTYLLIESYDNVNEIRIDRVIKMTQQFGKLTAEDLDYYCLRDTIKNVKLSELML